MTFRNTPNNVFFLAVENFVKRKVLHNLAAVCRLTASVEFNRLNDSQIEKMSSISYNEKVCFVSARYHTVLESSIFLAKYSGSFLEISD